MELQCCLEKLKGGRGYPIPRRNFLSFTWVGEVDEIDNKKKNCAAFTFFARDRFRQLQELNASLQRFWELETVGIEDDTFKFNNYYKRMIKKTTHF